VSASATRATTTSRAARAAILVEGTSDQLAVEALARRRGRDLEAEGVTVVAMGGYGNLPRLLERYGDLRLAGLYDAGEERHVLRALGCSEREELERAGFFACTRDLEDELTRAVGPDGMDYAPGDLSGVPTVVEFDPGSFVLTAFGRSNAGTVRGDQAVADVFLNEFFRI